MRSHHLRAAGGSQILVEDLRTELQKVGDAIQDGKTNYKISTYQGSGTGNFNISYDGGSTTISDGGGDMYDGGNYTHIVTENTPTSWTSRDNSDLGNCAPLSYLTTSVTNGSYGSSNQSQPINNYRFIASGNGDAGENHDNNGTLVMAATAGNYNSSTSMKIGFAHKGNLGADGSGSTTTRQLYNNASVDGFTVYAWDITTHGAGDPVVCNLYIFLGHPHWGTSFGTFSTYAHSNTDYGNRGVWSTGTQNNILAITALIAADNSGNGYDNQHTTSQLTPIIDDIIADIKAEFGY